MAEFNYNEIENYLDGLRKNASPEKVYLFYGDEYLYKKKLEDLLDVIVPGKKKKYQYETVDGTDGSIFDVIERLNTYSLLSGVKIVALTDARVFYSKQEKSKILDAVKEKISQEDMKAAAKKFVNFLSVSGLGYEDIMTPQDREKVFSSEEKGLVSDQIESLVSYCLENDLKIPASTDEATVLKTAIEEGFPKKHYLIITTDLVDKRRVLYKTINTAGVIFDCSVPSGSRKADTDIKHQIFQKVIHEILVNNRKKIEPGVIETVLKMTGYELRLVTGNIEKLISFTGDREMITSKDVLSVLKRTKKDPIYELTEAVSNRDLAGSVFYLDSLLSGGEYYPLQIMTALVNQLRKLMIAKDFTESSFGRAFRPGVQFHQFKNTIIKDAIAFDKKHLEESTSQKTGKKNAKDTTASSDLSLVKNPNNPYPVFQLLLKSDKFTRSHLTDSYERLYEADYRLKSTDLSPRLILEDVIIHICK